MSLHYVLRYSSTVVDDFEKETRGTVCALVHPHFTNFAQGRKPLQRYLFCAEEEPANIAL